MNIGDPVKVRTRKGGWRKATIQGIVQSFLTEDAYLIEHRDGTTEQLPLKYVKPDG